MSKAFITTSWDDGNPADARVAELLDRHGLTGTFYIPRSIDSGVMSGPALKELAGRFEIGAHTLNHRFLTEIDDAAAKVEIDGSRKWVQDETGQDCPMFCPPAGRFSSTHWKMLKSAGYTGARTVELMSLSHPRKRGGLMEMPTTLQAFPHPSGNYLKNMAKRRAGGNLWNYIIFGRSNDWATLADRLLARLGKGGGVFHLWGHSWEIEQTEQWERLEQVLSMMGEVARGRRDIQCLNNGQICAVFSEARFGMHRGAGIGAPGS
jgi:peptidoglycan/xylan/chitin deacetylase (PgdA/CDA1 family)